MKKITRSYLYLFYSLILCLIVDLKVIAQSNMPLFTEDFEKGKLDTAIWSKAITGQNSITIQSDKVAHGKNALLVRCPVISNKTWAFIATNKIPQALNVHHF